MLFRSQKLDLLQSELQLAHEREREATQAVAEATQMAKIAQDRAAKATESFELPLFKPRR